MFDRFELTTKRAFDAPLTIGVLSDTHIFPRGRRRLPPELIDLFRRFGCGLILHAGDVNTVHTLETLAEIAPVLAVTGNNDDDEMRRIASRDVLFSAGRFSFALLHGDGGATARSEARRFSERADVVVYGHSHIPMSERVGESILFNPGSATDRRWQEHFGVGLIFVSEDRVLPELVLYQDPRDLINVKPD